MQTSWITRKRLLMALSLCSCAVLLASCRASADTRTGQADGYGGILRVQVMMEDGAISAVNILEQHETDGIGSRALDILPDEMIRMNTWDVDVVTGATTTSNALREAVRVALNASDTMDEATGNPANRAGQAVREGIGMAATGRVGPGKDDEDGQVYSFNVVFAHGTFDEDGRIVSMAVDQLEVATPNYSGASMPQFSGFPGQGGYSLWDDNTGKVVGYTEDSEDDVTTAAAGGEIVLENAVTDSEKIMIGMGTKILIWPDAKSFDTATGKLEALSAAWSQTGTVTIAPCDAGGKTYTVSSVGTTEPSGPADGTTFLKQNSSSSKWAYVNVLEQYDAKSGKWAEILLNSVKMTLPGLAAAGFRKGDTITVEQVPGLVEEYLAEGVNGEVTIEQMDGDSIVLTGSPKTESTRYYGSFTVTAGGTT